jgi:hypothetical protein
LNPARAPCELYDSLLLLILSSDLAGKPRILGDDTETVQIPARFRAVSAIFAEG